MVALQAEAGLRSATDRKIEVKMRNATQHLRYIRQINAAIAERPSDLRVTIHMCRGTYRSSWAAEGGYDHVVEALFGELAVDGVFCEFDDERSGGFEPLRFVPPGKQMVLGLVTAKTGRLEDADAPQAPHRGGRDVPAAGPAVPLAAVRVLLHGAGQRLTVDEQKAKPALVVQVAQDVRG